MKNWTKKRILIFNWRDTKHKYAGGAEVYIHELAKRWVKTGHHVTLFCGNDSHSPRYEIVDGIEVIRRGGFYFVYIWAFLYYLLKFRGKYDVIFDCENGIPFFTPLYAKEPVLCLVHHVHQEVFRKYLSRPLSLIAEFLENDLMPWAYRNTKFIAVSDSTKNALERMGFSEISIVHNGVDLKKFNPSRKSKTPIILYVGRLKAYKSIDTILRAFREIHQKIPHAKLIITGKGEEKNTLQALVNKLDISSFVEFTGRVSEDEKIKLFQQAWVSVNPSFFEGWGITSIEANACGTPVVASNVPGLHDSVKNPHSGFLVPYGDVNAFADRIVSLLKDKKLRREMSVEAIKWAKKFDWDKSADKSLKLF